MWAKVVLSGSSSSPPLQQNPFHLDWAPQWHPKLAQVQCWLSSSEASSLQCPLGLSSCSKELISADTLARRMAAESLSRRLLTSHLVTWVGGLECCALPADVITMVFDIRAICTQIANDWGLLFMTHQASALSPCLRYREEVCKKLDAASQSALLAYLPWVADGLLDASAVEAALKALQLVVVVSPRQASTLDPQPSRQWNRCRGDPSRSSTESQTSSYQGSKEQAQATLLGPIRNFLPWQDGQQLGRAGVPPLIQVSSLTEDSRLSVRKGSSLGPPLQHPPLFS